MPDQRTLPITMTDVAASITGTTGDTLTVEHALFAANHWTVAAALLMADQQNPRDLASPRLLESARALQHNLGSVTGQLAVAGFDIREEYEPGQSGVSILKQMPD